MRILLVDDSPAYLELCQTLLLAHCDHQIAKFDNAFEAWWHVSDPARVFDLGILDLTMPGIGGLELLGRLRADPRIRQFPVIVCTGMRDRETVITAAKFGITTFIAKPFLPATFLAKVQAIAAQAEALAEPADHAGAGAHA